MLGWFLLGFIVGLFLGAIAGVFVICLARMGDND